MRTLPLVRRLWVRLPLSYQIVSFSLAVVMMAIVAVMAVTYASASDSLKLQLERQVSRDLNVLEKWYRTRLEEMQLTSAALVRHPELATALAEGRLAPAEPLLAAELRRLGVDFALLVDARGRQLTRHGFAGAFDPRGLVTEAIRRHEPMATTEAWEATLGRSGLVRLAVTPIGPRRSPRGALLLGEWVARRSPVPNQVTSMIGGAIGVLDMHGVVAESGFPAGDPTFLPAVWQGVREGRLFFHEQRVGDRAYMLAFRPIVDHRERTVGAFVRGFPENQIGETLNRYALNIFGLAAAMVALSLAAFFWLVRRLLFPLRRLARISSGLAAGDVINLPAVGGRNDEFGRLESGVVALADRLLQSREELAEAAVKLEHEARALAERNVRLTALGMENDRLLAAIRDHDRLRGQLIEKIISAQEDERKRIARELHDETGQSLTGLLVGLKVVEGALTLGEARERVTQLQGLAVQTLEAVHQLSVALRPALLDDLGLVVAVRSLVKDFGAQHQLAAHFHADALDGRLPPLWEVTLYRVVQEALTNVAKYARARGVEVNFRRLGPLLEAEVADDGVGFDPAAAAPDARERLGLLGMQERVALIGGEFSLHSTPGGGTRVRVRAPWPDGKLPPGEGRTGA